jgi:hypothetical protein
MAYCCSDFDILLEHIRTGEELPADHHLIQEKNLIEDAVKKGRPFAMPTCACRHRPNWSSDEICGSQLDTTPRNR